jgi:hypothetical protein
MDLEDVTKVILRRLLILGNVGKVGEIVGVLAGPVDVADLVLADGLLSSGRETDGKGENQIGGTKTIVFGIKRAMARAAYRPSTRVPWENQHRPSLYTKCRPLFLLGHSRTRERLYYKCT